MKRTGHKLGIEDIRGLFEGVSNAKTELLMQSDLLTAANFVGAIRSVFFRPNQLFFIVLQYVIPGDVLYTVFYQLLRFTKKFNNQQYEDDLDDLMETVYELLVNKGGPFDSGLLAAAIESGYLEYTKRILTHLRTDETGPEILQALTNFVATGPLDYPYENLIRLINEFNPELFNTGSVSILINAMRIRGLPEYLLANKIIPSDSTKNALAYAGMAQPTHRVQEFRICPTYLMVYCNCWFGRAGVKIFN